MTNLNKSFQINEEPAVFSPPPLPTRPWHSKVVCTSLSF